MKRVLLASLLATLLGGCVIVPWGYGHGGDERYRGNAYHSWHDGGRWNDNHNGYHDRGPGG